MGTRDALSRRSPIHHALRRGHARVSADVLPHAARLVIAAWIAIAASLVGIGALVRRLLGRPADSADDWLAGFWLGFATSIFALQLWQLAFPVDRRLLALLALAGAIGILAEGRAPWRLIARGLVRHAPAVVALAVVTGWLALEALGGPRNGDSGLYHVPTTQWHLAHRLPPGLGNLAAPFAYNQSFFLWNALLETGPLPGRASHVGNTLLVVALAARVLLGVSRLVRRRACRPADAFYGVLVPGVLPLALDVNVTSPSPDIAVYTIGLVLGGECVRFFTTGRRFADLAALACLVGCAPPLKLSLGGLAAGTGVVAGVGWLRRKPARDVSMLRAIATLGAIVLLGPGVWMLRGVVLSGYPLYPSALLAAPVDWAVPRETVVAEAKLIRYWNGVEGWWWAAWRDPAWFVRWLPTLDWLRFDVLLPLAIAGTGTILALGYGLVRRRVARALPAVVVIPTLVSIAYCIAAAPRARYPASAYWMLAAQTTWLSLPAIVLAEDHVLARRLAVLIAIVLLVPLLADKPELVSRLRDFEPHARAIVTERSLPSGLVVYDPGATMQCWDATLPCSPFRNDALALRVPGDLGSGFTVTPAR
jgi:hypothetical protein